MPLIPASLSPATSPTNPNIGYSTSGGSDGVQDWYVHVQTAVIMYTRRNQFNSDTSSTNVSPTVTSNWLDFQCTLQTQDEVYINMAFSSADSSSGNLFQPHVLQLQTNTGASGGFGDEGVVSTSAMGIIRRPAVKDAAGTILDTTGTCTETLSLVMDQMPGSYDAGYDTSSSVNAILAQAMGHAAAACPTFKATLVDL